MSINKLRELIAEALHNQSSAQESSIEVLRSVIIETLHEIEEDAEILPETFDAFKDWAAREGWKKAPSHLRNFPRGPAGELLDLFYGDLSSEGASNMGRYLKDARQKAARADQEAHDLMTAAYFTNQDAHAAWEKLRKALGKEIYDILKDPPPPGTPDAKLLDKARAYETAAKLKEEEVEEHADENQGYFDILDIYDLLVQENPIAIKVAEEMLNQHGTDAMSSVAIDPELRTEFVDSVANYMVADVKKITKDLDPTGRGFQPPSYDPEVQTVRLPPAKPPQETPQETARKALHHLAARDLKQWKKGGYNYEKELRQYLRHHFERRAKKASIDEHINEIINEMVN